MKTLTDTIIKPTGTEDNDSIRRFLKTFQDSLRLIETNPDLRINYFPADQRRGFVVPAIHFGFLHQGLDCSYENFYDLSGDQDKICIFTHIYSRYYTGGDFRRTETFQAKFLEFQKILFIIDRAERSNQMRTLPPMRLFDLNRYTDTIVPALVGFYRSTYQIATTN
ncbi:MAG: hypothetical protein LUF87_01890 [Alistipes sp.]|nr:hypothetical protein [Alistipes sp.]